MYSQCDLIFNIVNNIKNLKEPLMNKGKSNDEENRKSAISSIHSHEDHSPGGNHYLLDVPSPKFSSAMGDDVG